MVVSIDKIQTEVGQFYGVSLKENQGAKGSKISSMLDRLPCI